MDGTSRRAWVQNLLGLAAQSAVDSAPAPTALPAPDPSALLLNRTSFGIAGPDWLRVRAIGTVSYVEERRYILKEGLAFVCRQLPDK
jgi:hypothetical protein